VDFIHHWQPRTGLPLSTFIKPLDIRRERFHEWERRYGKENAHNCLIPRDHQLLPEERKRILAFYADNSLEGYRRLTYLMLDADIVHVSSSTTYRVLVAAGVLVSRAQKLSKKSKGFHQPDAIHRHWHVDITYIKIKGVFFYLILVLDGFSRYIVAWDLRERMTESDVEVVIQKGKEAFPGAKPRVISDNGSQFIAKEFKTFMALVGMTHTTTSPYYPQSNGKLERCNKTIKMFLRTQHIANYEDGSRLIGEFISYYNNERLHSAIGYVTPKDKLEGKEQRIFFEREEKLAQARARRKSLRQGEAMIRSA